MNEFAAIQAQSRVWSIVARSHSAGRLGSAYLICGPEGYGHWPVALAIAALINCERNQSKSGPPPCGECRSCRLIAAANFEGLQIIGPIKTHKNAGEAIELTAALIESRRKEPFTLLDASTPVTIPIDMARELKRSLSQKAPEGTRRVVIIYRIDRMKPEATDSLLKLVEEPPPDTTLLLTAINPEAVSPTIQSRCRQLTLEPIPESFIIEYLTSRHNVSAPSAKLLARISNRDLGRAISLVGAEANEGSERAVGLLLFKSLFVESSPSIISRLTDLMAEADRGQVEELVRLWSSLIRDCTAMASIGSEDDLVNVDFTADIKKLSRHFTDPEVAVAMTKALKNTLADLRLNVHIHPTLAALALRLQSVIIVQA